MLNWKGIVQNYIIKYSDKIRRVTRPLRDHLGVGYFTYHRIDKEGKYTVLVDRPDWAEHYVNEQFFLEDPYLRHPDVYQSGLCLIEAHGSEGYKNRVLKTGKERFNLDLCIILIKKGQGCVEFFGFAADRKSSSLERLYLNHSGLLYSFASHFKKELNPILFQMAGEASALHALKGKDFHCNAPIHPEVSRDALLACLESLGEDTAIIKAGLLSARERQCIKLLLVGCSAKETAVSLNLSRRTVEFYFENIKNKLSCSNKQEIFFMAKQFEAFGLI